MMMMMMTTRQILFGRSNQEKLKGGVCSTYGRKGKCIVYGVLVGKADVKRPLERHRRRWEDNIKVDQQEV
jgi:hypothetical protein